ncbi:hypothetical protein M405DRAFT_866050 [Rhizopogon salebrosus TDB-379]|nr:hypothetical protein M405DRAFT_866050 [Rhizopogon salebrosus TDB-379]
MQALAIHLRTPPPGSRNEEGRHYSLLGGVRFCLTLFILVILDWCAGNLATNHTRVSMQTFKRARSTTADTFTNPSPTAYQPVPASVDI